MRKLKKRCQGGLLALSIAGTMLAAPLAAAQAAFTDVPNAYWADRYIDYLTSRNIITGYPDNTFRPGQPVTRAEFAVMLAKSQGLTASTAGRNFVDVPGGHWAAQAIRAVAGQGWIAGYPGNLFRPNQNISMAEMYTILAKATNQTPVGAAEAEQILARFQDAAQVPAWARVSVATAIQSGIDVDEITPNAVDPNMQATRASVATSIAKLLNPSYRDTEVAGDGQQQPSQGEAVSVTGTLQATATPGEWVIVTQDGKRYYFTNPPESVSGQTWFRVGNQVRLSGNIDTQASTQQRTVVRLNELVAVETPQNRITVTGTVRPSTQTQGAWLVETLDNKVYRIMNPEAFSGTNLLRFGSNVTITGAVRPDVQLPQSEGNALVASEIKTAQTANQVAVTGVLRPTVEAGGWVVTVPATNQKYVLMGTNPVEGETWFREGAEVIVKGNVRTDIPTIYQEGPVLVLSDIDPTPSAITGNRQVSLYYPNLINIVRDPATMLGNPVTRVLQGPELPEKSIMAILQGPTDVERLQGFFVDEDVTRLSLDEFTLNPEGRATVVLEAPANFSFGNAATPTRLDEQISRTLRQFQGISEADVIIKGPNNTVIWSSQ